MNKSSVRPGFTARGQRAMAVALAVGFLASTGLGLNGFAADYDYRPAQGTLISQYQQYPPMQPAPAQAAPLQGYVMTAPAGTPMSATISSPISSEYARVGDRFTATLGTPVVGSNGVILPSGSLLDGQVMFVQPAGRAGKNGSLDIRFTSARTPNGQTIPLSARIQTEDGTGVIKGGSTAGRVGRAALKTGVGAGLGAALGTAMGPLSGGRVGRGAVYGTAVGAGAGALYSLWDKGQEAVLPSGQPVQIVLDQPLTSAPAYDPNAGGGYYAQPQQNYGQPYPNAPYGY